MATTGAETGSGRDPATTANTDRTRARLASGLVVGAYTLSAAYTLWRAWYGPTPEADGLDLLTIAGYVVAIAGGLALLTDHVRAWWTVTVLLVAQFVFAIVAYYPMTAAARPLDVLDGIEGTVFVGLLAAALVLCLQRLADLR
ncbi:hypothetical protein [Salsipaludibacter albus]|uniref:hypothetical protein n=1 Tax=Salsipaludibacter albus TaxID=2849650 RepID=UPI001EE4DE1A|nr:hypothetical protein [Salsipaludibacter albus]MBY5160934.1 hypothetical protein [Salsipaludibacter albus]